ncbi:MAG: diadenylate cyclase CdaA [Clostridia bacterium]|nr:diadenylate cyclase CdaA [Clostridia bacterium]
MWAEITTLFSKVISVFSTYNWLSDTLDLLLIAVVFYYLLKLLRDTRAITFTKGIVCVIVAYVIVLLLDMKSSAFIFRQIFNNLLVILVVLFAPELRKLLEKMGTSQSLFKLSSLFGKGARQSAQQYNEAVTRVINSVCIAAEDMSDKRIGALMIFERQIPLGEIIGTGTIVDATVTSQLVGNIFYPKSPLHDGAAVIRNNRLYAAGCILPLTERNNEVAKELGTRHRAALGMSEQSDALILVVSEETGAISIAEGGVLHRDLSDGAAREILLNAFLLDTHEEEAPKKPKRKPKGGDPDGE